MSMTVEEWRKGLKNYENANIQALNDIEFTSVVIDAIKKRIEEEEIKNMEMNKDGE